MAEALAALVAMREVSKPANSWLTFIIDDHLLDLDCNRANFFVQLSVTATLAAQTTEESQLMMVRKSEDPAEPMRAVEDVASSTDIAVLLAGKTTIHVNIRKNSFLTSTVTPRSRLATAGARPKVTLNWPTRRLARLSPRPNRRKL